MHLVEGVLVARYPRDLAAHADPQNTRVITAGQQVYKYSPLFAQTTLELHAAHGTEVRLHVA